jgi:hypothetical protein
MVIAVLFGLDLAPIMLPNPKIKKGSEEYQSIERVVHLFRDRSNSKSQRELGLTITEIEAAYGSDRLALNALLSHYDDNNIVEQKKIRSQRKILGNRFFLAVGVDDKKMFASASLREPSSSPAAAAAASPNATPKTSVLASPASSPDVAPTTNNNASITISDDDEDFKPPRVAPAKKVNKEKNNSSSSGPAADRRTDQSRAKPYSAAVLTKKGISHTWKSTHEAIKLLSIVKSRLEKLKGQLHYCANRIVIRIVGGADNLTKDPVLTNNIYNDALHFIMKKQRYVRMRPLTIATDNPIICMFFVN